MIRDMLSSQQVKVDFLLSNVQTLEVWCTYY